MALFALLNEQNKVVNVAVVSDAKLKGLPIPVPPEIIEQRDFLKDVEGTWVQTSKDFRGHVANIGDTYDAQRDLFIAPQPSEYCTLNENTGFWICPETPEEL